MSRPPQADWESKLNEWLLEASQGGISSSDKSALNQLLRSNPEARIKARQLLLNDTAFGDVFRIERAENIFAKEGPLFPQSLSSNWRLTPFWKQTFTLAASLALLLGSLAAWSLLSPQTTGQQDETTSATIAVLSRSVGAHWESDSKSPRPGEVLEPTRLKLKAGLIQIDFLSGAQVVIEGPADLQLVSESESFCRNGKLRVETAPQSHGFKIETPDVALNNPGTIFGLEVNPDTGSGIHAIKGRLEIYPAKAQTPTPLQENTALHLDPKLGTVMIASNPGAFTAPADLEERMSQHSTQRFLLWKGGNSATPPADLLVHYTFEKDSQSQLKNHGTLKLPETDGYIVGSQWVSGRWPEKSALDFKRVSDRVHISVPGEFDAVTWMAWVRVDSLPNKLNGLLLDTGIKLHWQITNEGQLQLGAQGPKVREFGKSPPVITPELFGQWIQLCSSIDGIQGKVCHYLNGTKVSESPIQHGLKFQIGQAWIGNWTQPGEQLHAKAVRNFNGRIDEILLFSRALGSEEVRRLFEWGDPNLVFPLSTSNP